MINLKYLAFAKINLGLKILNKRLDGYHNINSLFIELDFFDELHFSPSNKYALTIEGPSSTMIPTNHTNLISKAYNIIREKYVPDKNNYSVHLIKNIPVGGGLGGGSSNAATTIIALNNLWKLKLSNNELQTIGKKIGADVPFFINGGTQIVAGVGDILKSIKTDIFKKYHFLLIMPSIQISTSEAYVKLNKSLQENNNIPKFPPLLEPINWELFENDFEQVISTTYPEIGHIKAEMKASGALYAGLSGSGSTVFGIYDNHHRIDFILDKFSQYQAILTHPVSR